MSCIGMRDKSSATETQQGRKDESNCSITCAISAPIDLLELFLQLQKRTEKSIKTFFSLTGSTLSSHQFTCYLRMQK